MISMKNMIIHKINRNLVKKRKISYNKPYLLIEK